MKTKIDLRSALLGLLAGIILTLTIGAAGSSPGQAGRFQVAGTSNFGLVVDTATGQVWTQYFHHNSGPGDVDFKRPKIQ